MLSDYAAKRMTFLIPRRLFSKGRRSVPLGNPGFRTNGLKLFAFAPKKRAFSEDVYKRQRQTLSKRIVFKIPYSKSGKIPLPAIKLSFIIQQFCLKEKDSEALSEN